MMKGQAIRDPLRLAILNSLMLGPASVAELATRLDATVEQVRYQVKCLRAVGMVTTYAERERRGANEHVFIADSGGLVLSREEACGLSEYKLRELCVTTLADLFGEAVEAIRTGALGDDGKHFIVRIPLLLDARGFREVSERFETAVTHLLALRDECLERLEEREEKPTAATSGLLFFELPG
ncbi:MAG: ArsR family transcriptional regulator [Solirubrobacterales bacterium]